MAHEGSWFGSALCSVLPWGCRTLLRGIEADRDEPSAVDIEVQYLVAQLLAPQPSVDAEELKAQLLELITDKGDDGVQCVPADGTRACATRLLVASPCCEAAWGRAAACEAGCTG